VYKGEALVQSKIKADNVQKVDISEKCAAGDKYFICEKFGIIITNSVKVSFTTLSKTGSCTRGLPTVPGPWTELGCTA
jgi:hypothetical protein